MKIEKIAKKKQKKSTFKDLKVGDVFRDMNAAAHLMKLPPTTTRRTFDHVNAFNIERNMYVFRTDVQPVIRIDATLVVKE